ncbi:MAG: ATP-binding protein [Chloroflexota bacterium]
MRRPSLQFRLFLAITVGIVVLASVFSLLATATVRQNSERMLEERVILSQLAGEHLDDAINQSLLQLGQVAPSPIITPSEEPSDAGKGLIDSIYRTLAIAPAYVSLVSVYGKILWTSPYSPDLVGRDLSAIESLGYTLRTGKPFVSDVLRDVGYDRYVVYLGAPMKDAQGVVQALAVATIDLGTTNIAEFVEPLRLGETGYAQVVDSNGVILAATKKDVPLFTKGAHSGRFAVLIAQGQTTKGMCHDCHVSGAGETARTEELLAFAPLSAARWGIMIAQSEEEATAPLRELQSRMLLAGLLVLVTAVPLSWVGLRSILKPLQTLEASSRRIARGDLETGIPQTGYGEIGALSQSLDEMRLKLQQSRQELQGRVSQRTHELAALVRASQSLTSTLGLTELLNSVVATAVDTLEKADSGVLFLREPDSGHLVPKSAIGYDWEMLSYVRLASNEGLAGMVFTTGRPIICNTEDEAITMLKTLNEANRLSLLEARGGKNPLSMIGVPLELKGTTLGSLVLSSYQQPSAFSADEAQFISSFAAIAATMLEHHRLVEEARQAESLREMDRVKTEFLSNISHELRTPLTSIMISTDSLLTADTGGDGARAKLLQNIRRNSERLNKLVGDLLDISQLQTGAMKLSLEPILLQEAIRESIETVRPLAEAKQLTVSTSIPADVLFVRADRGRLVQVLINLLTNAVNFTPNSGSIRVAAASNGSLVQVSVVDTGIGIPEEELGRIFDRFYRSSRGRTKGGMGLGLSIAKALVELHGGAISVKSKPGHGSEFTFTIPLAKET